MPRKKTTSPQKVLALAKPYYKFILLILLLSLFTNGLNLAMPKIVASALDAFTKPGFKITFYVSVLMAIATGILIVSSVQSILQTYLSELIARDLRDDLIEKISQQPFSFIAQATPEKLLTNLTGDIDNIKQVIAQGLVQIFSSIIIIFGAIFLLLSINRGLALIVLTIIPLIGILFFSVFKKIRKFFKKSQAVIDALNKTINESIVASALIRIINSQHIELEKFAKVNTEAQEIGITIVNLFSSLIPLIGIISNFAVVTILFLGGRSIIAGNFTVGNFTAFTSYISMLIFPVIVLGFISNAMARAAVSYERILAILEAPKTKSQGTVCKPIKGNIKFKNINLSFGEKQILKNISFEIKAGSRTAILGPTAAGKTQIFYLLAGLLKQQAGEILIDQIPFEQYSRQCLSDQIGLVFQDSSIFNTTIEENINFKNSDNKENLTKAIETAHLKDFIDGLPQGLQTKIAERGSSLSGGQKQRLTLARALVINPKVLLLDDFTARVDKQTESKIFKHLKENYSHVTQILIAQQISSVQNFDKIILIMEGEILAQGSHEQLLEISPEYRQIYNSQMSLT